MAVRFEFFYLIEIQYLGFRYHGWQFQPGLKTLQGTLEKTLNFLFAGEKFKILGAGRTDAMVSAESAYFELFTNEELDVNRFQHTLDDNLPADIQVVDIQTVDKEFNIIQDVREKIYHYYFASVEEKYPFASPFMNCIREPLDVEMMSRGAKLFEGENDFQFFITGDAEKKNTIRKIEECSIEKNSELSASFFPNESFVFKIRGKGFMRYQIRLMMGALIRLGRKEISLQDISNALEGNLPTFQKLSAAASGLRVKAVSFRS
ncbi:tRNA pseudouridine(38-40) synthase TruA [Marivirga harenae]|uniref:tRNA pseudouridine(38-40) synthase TruA n=1 Tax=Marivirga harenae TaxID=2010992 RepID=UPI0026E04ACA|nr:tRNA pseudouridine(38-40) synthase TruA [Marivirga harenae]WKV11993.1 tRNA pseudouridine(38-40) synthase TruA [Marivirga harenae]